MGTVKSHLWRRTETWRTGTMTSTSPPRPCTPGRSLSSGTAWRWFLPYLFQPHLNKTLQQISKSTSMVVVVSYKRCVGTVLGLFGWSETCHDFFQWVGGHHCPHPHPLRRGPHRVHG